MKHPGVDLGDCNFYYSLLGIETWQARLDLLFHSDCNFYYSLLGIETRGLEVSGIQEPLQFLLLPIRDWNRISRQRRSTLCECELQFLLLPIRDWNDKSRFPEDYMEVIAISTTPY